MRWGKCPRLFGWTLNAITSIFIRERQRDFTQMEEKGMGPQRRQRLDDAATSQGTLAAPAAGRGRHEFSLRVSTGSTALATS